MGVYFQEQKVIRNFFITVIYAGDLHVLCKGRINPFYNK